LSSTTAACLVLFNGATVILGKGVGNEPISYSSPKFGVLPNKAPKFPGEKHLTA
jgi:hypothetical protein